MNTYGTGYGEPVRSLQTFLRRIAESYPAIPPVVPDGIFDTQTKAAVTGFQATFLLEITGEADSVTWAKIIAVYDEVLQAEGAARPIRIYPADVQTIYPPEAQSHHLYAIQGVLRGLTQRLPTLGTLEVSGVHDAQSVAVVKNIQQASGLPPTGILDPLVWDSITRLYERHLSHNRLENIK